MIDGEFAKFAFAIFTPSGSHTQVCCPGPTCPPNLNHGQVVLFRARYVRSAATEPPSQHSRAAVVPCGYRAPAVAHSSMASLVASSGLAVFLREGLTREAESRWTLFDLRWRTSSHPRPHERARSLARNGKDFSSN